MRTLGDVNKFQILSTNTHTLTQRLDREQTHRWYRVARQARQLAISVRQRPRSGIASTSMYTLTLTLTLRLVQSNRLTGSIDALGKLTKISVLCVREDLARYWVFLTIHLLFFFYHHVYCLIKKTGTLAITSSLEAFRPSEILPN